MNTRTANAIDAGTYRVRFRNATWDTLSRLALAEAELHLWAMPFHKPGVCSSEDRSVISPSEWKRAEDFVFDRDRSRYIASHVLLRRVLSAYVNTKPSEIGFASGPFGKPILGETSAGAIQFNLCHCDLYAIVAVSRESVGVDIESVRNMEDRMSIARSVFTKREYDTLSELTGDDQCRAFFQCWTRKEAVVKALGTGLLTSLKSFEVTLHPTFPSNIWRFNPSSGLTQQWRLIHIEPESNIIGAVAVPARITRVRAFRINT